MAASCTGCGGALKAHWKRCPVCRTARGASSTASTPPGEASGSSGRNSSPFLTALEPPSAATPSVAVPVLPAGSALGKYRIERVLGTGAYGTVYAAHDPGLGETVAVKAVGTFGDAEALRAAVAAEYKIQRGLPDKRHILESYPPEVVEACGVRWVLLPMEMATGTLREWLTVKAGKPEHLDEGLVLLRQAVAGLQVLHAAGLVHRDVKPENLLLAPDANAKSPDAVIVKVADFGLASGLEKLASTRPELVGDGIGTPAYMAPEQVMAAHWKDVTPAADAYAIGTILFELLDGERPYSGTAEQLRAKKRDRALAPRTPSGPTHLAELALALLQPDCEQRPQLGDIANTHATEATVAVLPQVTPPSGAPIVLGRGFGDDQFVRCEPGRFTMGCAPMGSSPNFDNRAHEVTLTRGFWMQKAPLTQVQWIAVMGSNPSHFSDNELRPVEQVSWEDAQTFLRALNQQTGKEFRLPTEAEWEYACRAGTPGGYAGSPDELAWYSANSGHTTHPVATRTPNAWGLYDMHGNVWEWCQDCYAMLPEARAQDPTGATSGSARVLRGGSWVNDDYYARSFHRYSLSASFRSSIIGFRLARNL